MLSKQNLNFAFLMLSVTVLLLGFQNCGGSFSALKSGGDSSQNEGVDLGYIPEAAVNYNVRYDSATQMASTIPAAGGSQLSSAQLMAKLKYKGCMFNALVSEPIAGFDEFVSLLGRSECESLPRAIETWSRPPDWNYIKAQMAKVESQTGKQYHFGMFIAESISTTAVYKDGSGQNFNFTAMCKPGTAGLWGANTCVPTTASDEYIRYLRFVIEGAIDTGVVEVLFGQTGHQDQDYRLGQLIHEFRMTAKARGHSMIFGQQPNGNQPEAYLKAFDFIVGPVYVDKDVSQACLPGIPGCQAVLFHRDVVNRAHNVIAEFDWYSQPNDDIHNFAKKPIAARRDFLDQRVSELWGRGVGFVMPFRILLSGDRSGKFCYGHNEWIYSPHNQYGCKDEDFINQFLTGNFAEPPADPALSREQAIKIVNDTFRSVLERTDAQMNGDTEGVEYWVGRLQSGTSVDIFRQHLMNSEEFYVRGLFKSILRRPADTPGLQFYVNQLETKAKSRAQVKADIQYVCDRALNTECAWNKQVDSGTPPVVTTPPATTIDYTAKAKSILTEVFGRTTAENNSDSAGISYWANRLKAGYSETQMRADLRASDEFFVRGLYQSIFKRSADTAGLKFYLDLLKSGAKSRAQIQADFNYLCQQRIGECK